MRKLLPTTLPLLARAPVIVEESIEMNEALFQVPPTFQEFPLWTTELIRSVLPSVFRAPTLLVRVTVELSSLKLKPRLALFQAVLEVSFMSPS